MYGVADRQGAQGYTAISSSFHIAWFGMKQMASMHQGKTSGASLSTQQLAVCLQRRESAADRGTTGGPVKKKLKVTLRSPPQPSSLPHSDSRPQDAAPSDPPRAAADRPRISEPSNAAADHPKASDSLRAAGERPRASTDASRAATDRPRISVSTKIAARGPEQVNHS